MACESAAAVVENMFSQLDHRSKHALAMAQAAALELQHAAIGPEHLLLGILRTEGPVSDALQSLGIDLEKARAAVEAVTPRGTEVRTGRGGLPCDAAGSCSYRARRRIATPA